MGIVFRGSWKEPSWYDHLPAEAAKPKRKTREQLLAEKAELDRLAKEVDAALAKVGEATARVLFGKPGGG